jgi:hypothetical protein
MSTGLGVMINMLGGNADTGKAVQAAQGREIASVKLVDDTLRIGLVGGEALVLRDDGQSCCENRYMHSDDDFSAFVGGQFLGA